jgi:hypothetical protein
MKPNQNLVIAQVVNHLNANGYLAWRQENNGRIDENELVKLVSKLLVALAHVKYDLPKVATLVKEIVRKCYRPVPSSLKGVPDVIGFHLETAKWITVEIKIGNDQLRPDQEEFIKILKRAGGDCWVIREINSFKVAFARKYQQLQAA